MNNAKLTKQRNLWFERLMAMIATVNLGLVFFNLSYLSNRDFYLKYFPKIPQVYDQLKGIEPHRETEDYLATVETLKKQVSQTGLQSPQVEQKLEELRRLSTEMIDSNPFAIAGKSGKLAKIKNQMLAHTRQKSSAKLSFNIFWSQAYLSQKGWKPEISFFDKKIAPLIASNYYRHIGENDKFIDNFWIIDLPFVILFGIELLARSFYIKSHHRGFSWSNAIFWRWYDLFLLLPFSQWLRIIPVCIRLDQSQLLNLQPVRQQIHLGIVVNFAEELTEIIVVRVINQIQGLIQRGELVQRLLQKDNNFSYKDINNINEVEAITNLLVQTTIYQVLPKVQPEIVAILRHNIESVLNQTPIYRNLQIFPLVEQMQTQLSEQLAIQITTNLYNTLVAATLDPVAAKLTNQLVQSFSAALRTEIQEKQVLSEIQNLLLDFLEEVKINYVHNMSSEDIVQTVEQTKQLRTQVAIQPVLKSPKS